MSTQSRSWLYPILGGLLLALSWPPLPFTFLVFLSLVPFLQLEAICREKKVRFGYYFLRVYVGLVIWNVLTTFWIYNTSIKGAVLINLINPLIQSIPLLVFHLLKRRGSPGGANLILVVSWISIEYFHHNWPFSFPFLTLGNALSRYPWLIQFYEFSGVLGGTLWILVFNIFNSSCINEFVTTRRIASSRIYAGLALILPLLVSVAIYMGYEEKGSSVKVAVLHPNIDCRNTKYQVQPELLIEQYVNVSRQAMSNDLDYLVWPETAITNARWISDFPVSKIVTGLRRDLLGDSKAKLVSGAILYESFRGDTSNLPGNIRFNKEFKYWYFTYNSAFQIGGGMKQEVLIRTKAKLVPVEETVPWVDKINFLRTIIGSLGGFSFSTRESNQHQFDSGNGVKVTPLICYESIFGGLTSSYVKGGANLLFVILNEGWYKNIYGASQFMYYSSVRAVENRRSIARSSNDGVSCFINQRGDIDQQVDEFKPQVILQTLYANRAQTIYTIFGDLLAKACALVFIVLLATFAIRRSASEKERGQRIRKSL